MAKKAKPVKAESKPQPAKAKPQLGKVDAAMMPGKTPAKPERISGTELKDKLRGEVADSYGDGLADLADSLTGYRHRYVETDADGEEWFERTED